MLIEKAGHSDLEEILALQKLAYQSEAALLNDWTIQPLTQSLDEVEREFFGGIILKMTDDGGRIVGSLRCRAAGGTGYIGKVIVHPDRQNGGLGSQLMRELERVCPCPRYELFTSAGSPRNLRFYRKLGYVSFQEKEHAPGLTMVYFEKRTFV
jgi:ribosomal protein S18 acetylase RimI-like enzyme